MQPAINLNKNDILFKFSDPNIVQQKAYQFLGKEAIIYKSTHKNKKYMIFNKENNKFIHFGELGFEDYTKHNDLNRLNNFKLRNNKWKNSPKYSPAFLSFYLLW